MSCRHDLPGEIDAGGRQLKSGSVVTMVTGGTDGIIRFSLDAPAQERPDVWIDLDGNGLRAEDGSEEVEVFNVRRDYTLASGVSKIAIHGNITYLNGASNRLTEVDVSGNPALVVLNLPVNDLATIDVSHNAALERLDISNNRIHSLNISASSKIVSLWCFNNKLKTLDLSENVSLTELDCSGNELTGLDLSANGKLRQLLAYNNRLTTLDISQTPLLNRLWLFGNGFSDAEMRNILSSLRSTIGGDLWMAVEPLNDALTAVAAEKGWRCETDN